MAANQKTIVILIAVFLGVIAASAAILLVLPGDDGGELLPALQTPASDTIEEGVVEQNSNTATGSSAAAGAGFDLRVFQRTIFQALNIRFINEGNLPVQPPSAVGKANPFL